MGLKEDVHAMNEGGTDEGMLLCMHWLLWGRSWFKYLLCCRCVMVGFNVNTVTPQAPRPVRKWTRLVRPTAGRMIQITWHLGAASGYGAGS